MHELTVAGSILELIRKRQASLPPNHEVLQVEVRVGEFRNVDPESLDFAFNNLRLLYDDCHRCRLALEVAPALARCVPGNHAYRPLFEQGFRCTECGGGIASLETGEELDIVGYTIAAKEDFAHA